MRTVDRFLLACVLMILASFDAEAGDTSKAPAWNARGVGPLPWQGVSALHVSADGRRIVVGTIAPAKDPNVIVLDETGKVVAQYAVGQRWIESVAALPDDTSVAALCTHADGTANDFPTVFLRGTQTGSLPPASSQEGFATAAFHYGDHSNHLGLRMLSCANGIWVNSGKSALWYASGQLKTGFTANLPVADDAVSTAAAALPNGTLVLGYAVPFADEKALSHNLFVFGVNERRPLWTRAAQSDLSPVPTAEKGAYGAPTLRNGEKLELEQWDVPVSGPLSIALHPVADGALAQVATATYRGWQRWVISSATNRKQHIGTRMMPGKPVISVLDGTGALIKRFEAEKFAEAAWLDLRFLPDGKRLIAWPHRWNARGLGGSAFLPADEAARVIYVLEIETGEVNYVKLPDAIVDVVPAANDAFFVSCWDGGLYCVDASHFVGLPKPAPLGGAALLAATSDGARVIAARADGVVLCLDATLREQWRCDLNTTVTRAEKPWVKNANAQRLAAGLWTLPGGRTESDLGGQRVVEAPNGLILIEAHSALSFESEWEAIKKAGLDPMRVKYVLATHEHGDHAPGAYLWRVTAGAQFVCSEEMAYTLQHHIPLNTGYGFHPPVPTDMKIKEDTELDLAGLKVRAIRAPGHTAGSMAWRFERDGKQFLAIGDLIMPHGPLGYSGSINFSGHDVLASLRKLTAINADLILAGHGPVLPLDGYLGEGIETGTRVGWGKIPPSNPDPRFRISQPNVIVAAWNIGAQSAWFGDFNGDSRPDIAAVSLNEAHDGAVLRIFLNHGGKFSSAADKEIAVPGVSGNNLKLAVADLNGDHLPDFSVSGQNTALLISRGNLEYDIHTFSVSEVINVFPGDEPKAAPEGVSFARRFGSVQQFSMGKGAKLFAANYQPEIAGPYLDFRKLDLNGDGRPDLVTSYGHFFLSDSPPMRLIPESSQWRFFAIGDFNGDRRQDLFFAHYELSNPAAEFLNTGYAAHPFKGEPDRAIPWPVKEKEKISGSLQRATLATADWNGDGCDDVFMAIGQSKEIHILFGSPAGLDPATRRVIPLDYHLHHETGLFVADFNGDGKLDIAGFGYTETGVGTNGPLAVYVWCQP